MTHRRKVWMTAALLFLLVACGTATWWRRKHHPRLENCLASLLSPSSPRYVTSLDRTFRANFSKNENPISEGRNWVNSGVCRDLALCPGASGSNIVSSEGRAFGTQTGGVPPPYTDSGALVAGNWGSDQFVEIVIWWDGAPGTNEDFDEVEIRLRGTLAKNFSQTYNINCRIGTPSEGSYIQMGRANGPPDDFTPPIAELKGPKAACQNGDVIAATIVGNLITAYINEKMVIQGTDSVITSGAPGFGFFHQGNYGQNNNFGVSSFIATDSFPGLSGEMWVDGSSHVRP